MKLHALCASAVALTLALASPAHAELSMTDRTFVIVTTGSIIVATICPGYDIPDGAVRKQADLNGADFDGLSPAIGAAMSAQLDREYDRTALIPDVTQVVRAMFLEMNSDFDRS